MQKIITTYIDMSHGDQIMRQIMAEAGEGSWRIVSMLDLHRVQADRQHHPGNPDSHKGDLVLVVLEDTTT
jgi:hypothetical protein